MSKKIYRIILVTILICAILVRIYNDPMIPYHYDPGKNIVYSRAILDSFPLFPQYNQYFNLGEYYEYQVLFPYIVALLYNITGFSLGDITATLAIVVGSLTVITIYLLSKEIFNSEMAALISAGLIALSKIQLFSYMNYYPQIMALMLVPLSFIFIIRYTRTPDKKYIVYISILSVLIILSSYLTGIIYLSILALSLIIYSIIRKELKYVHTFISIIIGIIALIAFYILPIIDRHGIRSFIVGIINTIFTQKDIPFTNVDLPIYDKTILKIFGFTAIIIFIIGISLIIYLSNRKSRLINFNNTRYEHILLFIWIIIPLILIESYRFRPILWVDRYVEILDMVAIIITGYSINFIANKIKNNKYLISNYKYILVWMLILVFAYPTYDVVKHNYRFARWDTPSDLAALNYVENNISSESLFVAPSGITSFWVSALGGVHVLGGESSQMLGEKFDGNTYSDTIINSPNTDEKLNLIRKFGVQYIYLTIRPKISLLWRNDYNIEGIKALGDERYFELAYRKQDSRSTVYVIKVKENLIPKYNRPNTNRDVTIFGYLISMMTLIIMITIVYSQNYDKKYG